MSLCYLKTNKPWRLTRSGWNSMKQLDRSGNTWWFIHRTVPVFLNGMKLQRNPLLWRYRCHIASSMAADKMKDLEIWSRSKKNREANLRVESPKKIGGCWIFDEVSKKRDLALERWLNIEYYLLPLSSCHSWYDFLNPCKLRNKTCWLPAAVPKASAWVGSMKPTWNHHLLLEKRLLFWKFFQVSSSKP